MTSACMEEGVSDLAVGVPHVRGVMIKRNLKYCTGGTEKGDEEERETCRKGKGNAPENCFSAKTVGVPAAASVHSRRRPCQDMYPEHRTSEILRARSSIKIAVMIGGR